MHVLVAMAVLAAAALGAGCTTNVAPGALFEVAGMTVTTEDGSDPLPSSTTEIEVCCRTGDAGPELLIELDCDLPDVLLDDVSPALTILDATPSLEFDVAGPLVYEPYAQPVPTAQPGDFQPFDPAMDVLMLDGNADQRVVLRVTLDSCGFETAGFTVEVTVLPTNAIAYDRERRRFDIVNTCFDGTLTLEPSRGPLGTFISISTDVDFFDVGISSPNTVTFKSDTNSVSYEKSTGNPRSLIVQVPTCPLGEGTPSGFTDLQFEDPSEGLAPAVGVASVFADSPGTVPVTVSVTNGENETREGTFTYERRLLARELHRAAGHTFGGIAARGSTVLLTAYEDILTLVPGQAPTTFSDGADGSGILAGIAVDASRVIVANDGLYGVQSVDSQGGRSLLAARPDFASPGGIALGPVPDVYVVDWQHTRVSRIDGDGVTVLAGGGPEFEDGYVDGPGASARFNQPQGIAIDGAGDLYIADTNNEAIRKITLPPRSTGVMVSTLLGGPGTGTPANGVAIDDADNLFATSATNLFLLPAGAGQLVQLTKYGAPDDYPELLTQVVTVHIEGRNLGGYVAVDDQGMVYLAMISTVYRVAAE